MKNRNTNIVSGDVCLFLLFSFITYLVFENKEEITVMTIIPIFVAWAILEIFWRFVFFRVKEEFGELKDILKTYEGRRELKELLIILIGSGIVISLLYLYYV